jgi:hypothetical protein
MEIYKAFYIPNKFLGYPQNYLYPVLVGNLDDVKATYVLSNSGKLYLEPGWQTGVLLTITEEFTLMLEIGHSRNKEKNIEQNPLLK